MSSDKITDRETNETPNTAKEERLKRTAGIKSVLRVRLMQLNGVGLLCLFGCYNFTMINPISEHMAHYYK